MNPTARQASRGARACRRRPARSRRRSARSGRAWPSSWWSCPRRSARSGRRPRPRHLQREVADGADVLVIDAEVADPDHRQAPSPRRGTDDRNRFAHDGRSINRPIARPRGRDEGLSVQRRDYLAGVPDSNPWGTARRPGPAGHRVAWFTTQPPWPPLLLFRLLAIVPMFYAAAPCRRGRFRAVFTRQTCVNAWGKLPSCRFASGSYSWRSGQGRSGRRAGG